MYISDLSKDTIFVRKVEGGYLVSESEEDGVVTRRVTKNPLKARQYTLENAFTETYTTLGAREAAAIIEAHKSDDSYRGFMRRVGELFEIVTTTSIDYGYSKDIPAERKLLESVHMDYVFKGPTVVVQEAEEE